MPGLPDIPTGIEAIANTAFDSVDAAIGTLQEDYKTANGRYFQGLKTGLPVDGVPEAPDKTQKPFHQSEDWNDFGIVLPATSVIGFSFHIFDGPDGQGYSLIGHISIAGKSYERRKGYENHGMDTAGTWINISDGDV